MRSLQAAAGRLVPVAHRLTRPTLLGTFGAMFFGVFVVGLAILAALQPGYGYDYIPYFGATLEWTGVDSATAHRRAYMSMQSVAPPDVFCALTTGDAYRLRQFADPAAFSSVLPFYSVKIGYLSLLAAALAYGDPVVWAWTASLLAGLGTGFVAALWLRREGALSLAPAIAALMLGAGFFELLRVPSPDAIATALLLLAAMLWLRGQDRLWLLPLAVAFLFRPDTVIFALALTLAAPLFGQKALSAALAFLAMLAASFWLESMFGHPGWWVHYWFSNVEIQPTLEGFDAPFSLLAYLKGQARGLFGALTQTGWLAPAALVAILGLASLKLPKRPSDRAFALFLACAMAIAGKFVLFPLPDDRLYFAFVIMAALCIASTYARALTGVSDQRPDRSFSMDAG